jgi:hypothetical protein
MKKILLLLFLINIGAIAQISEKNVEVTNKYYEVLRILKQNKQFEFIIVPKQMTQVYNGQDLSYTKISGKDYVMRIYPNNDVTIHQKVTGDRHYLSIVNKTMIGYSLITDMKSKKIKVHYYEGSKITYDTEIQAE